MLGWVADSEAQAALSAIQIQYARLENGRTRLVVKIIEIHEVVEHLDQVTVEPRQLFDCIDGFHSRRECKIFGQECHQLHF